MNRTHGNCAEWKEESVGHVMCLCGTMLPCWYSKHGNARKCPLWKPRNEELHLKTRHIVADYYEGDKKPHFVAVYASDGKKYLATEGHITRALIAGWESQYRHYDEDGMRHCEVTITGGEPVDFVAIRGSEISG